MAASVYSKNLVLNYLLRGVDGAAPSTWFIALFTDDPIESISNEVGVTEYERQAVTFEAALGGVVKNSADITWGTATEDWGTLTHYAIFDALTGGNMLISGELLENADADVGTVINLPAGAVEISLE